VTEQSQPVDPPETAAAAATQAAPTAQARLAELRTELVKWVEQFPGVHGRLPTAEDIKQDQHIGDTLSVTSVRVALHNSQVMSSPLML
jgi:hypothetical protein